MVSVNVSTVPSAGTNSASTTSSVLLLYFAVITAPATSNASPSVYSTLVGCFVNSIEVSSLAATVISNSAIASPTVTTTLVSAVVKTALFTGVVLKSVTISDVPSS